MYMLTVNNTIHINFTVKTELYNHLLHDKLFYYYVLKLYCSIQRDVIINRAMVQ